MAGTCVEYVIECLSSLNNQQWPPYKETQRLRVFEIDLRFIRMFLEWSVSWGSTDANHLRSILDSIEYIWQYDKMSKDIDTMFNGTSPRQIKKAINKMGKRILFSKQEIKKCCEDLMNESWTYNTLASHEILQFLNWTIFNLDHLAANEILPVNNQFEIFKYYLLIFWNLIEFTGILSADCKVLQDFNSHVLTWANKAASLTFLYWEAIDVSALPIAAGDEDYWRELVGEKEYEANRICLLVDDLVKKVNPCTPEYIDMYLELIKLTKSSHSQIILVEEFAPKFVDFLLQNLMYTLGDDFLILREGLIFLITFLPVPPINYAENSELVSFHNQIVAVLVEVSRVICLCGDSKVAFTSQKDVLPKLMEMIDQVNGKIYEHYVQLPHSSWSFFPRTSGLGFVESLLVYLEDLEETMSGHPKLVPFLEQQIFTIKDELKPLRQFLDDILELKNENKELKDLWDEIISVAYQAELTIKQSFFVDVPLCISYVLGKIQAIQSKITRVKGTEICMTRVISSLNSSANMLTVSVPRSWVDEEVVGFKQEAEELIDRLTRGTTQLDIVSIFGMGGIGKTTLAKKLYNEASVRHCFHKRAFCTISQVYSKKNILLDILSQVSGKDVNENDTTEADYILNIYQSLKGNKYLIVLDDLWGVNAWYDVKDSFPNDNNRSRIMFTTRVYDVASLETPNGTSHGLRFLTIDESWELLQGKIFHKTRCPPFLWGVGRSIAKNCKGLPLAIVVVAGLLAKSERSLSWWQKVADKLTSYVSSEGCWDIIDLSYQHLSEASKACFLYLGAFPEDYQFSAGRITKLWAAEGFVVKSNKKSVDKIAKEYLNYLGERSLLVVTKRSLAGNIKSFRLHDVIQEFCMSKAQEEHLIYLVNGHDTDFATPLIYDQYRICVQSGSTSFINANNRGPSVHSLLCLPYSQERTECLPSSCFRNLRLIQVLDILPVMFPDFPAEITMLVHLRYLALTCDCTVCHVPPTIANLRNLETLIVYTVVYLPNTIWKLKRLRHLEFPFGCHFDGLDAAESEVFSELPELETLSKVSISKKEEIEELLRRIPNVRKLSFRCDELPEPLVDLSKLESIVWEGNCKSVLSLPSTLRRLMLMEFKPPGSDLSTWIALNNLPCLQVLKLIGCEFYGNTWDVEDEEFPNLKCLTLSDKKIRYWNATTDSFPRLEKLSLKSCTKLAEIPPCFGEIPTLRALELYDCSEGVVTSAVQIQKDQFELGNESLEFVVTERKKFYNPQSLRIRNKIST